MDYIPNCVDPEGCLFCDKYRLHVDEIDIRKLASCKYFIESTAHLIGDFDRQEILVKPVISKISKLLEELKKFDHILVEKIIKEVERNGELDTYWQHKLELFIELGLA